MSSVTTKKTTPDWNTLLTEKRDKKKKKDFPSFSGAAAHSIVLSASLLPDYARPRHTQAPQSMPHATLPLCTQLLTSLGSRCQDQ